MQELIYLSHYPLALRQQAEELVAAGRLRDYLLEKYPDAHQLRSNKALYQYAVEMKNKSMRQSRPLKKVLYDDKIQAGRGALGLHTTVSRVQGGKLKASQEIRVASMFRKVPLPFLRMILAHELAHFREKDHDKAFYQLCVHIEPSYHQWEFDTRLYLTCVALDGQIY